MDEEKTVFISYRRDVSAFVARSIFMDLRDHGYDVFMDVESLDSGTFDKIILNQIAARAHFLVILAPRSIERFDEPGDWLRREIEHAIELNRNIVPVLVNGFKFGNYTRHFTGRLSDLPRYNALTVPHDFFDAAMEKLRTRFLRKPVAVTIQPTPPSEQPVIERKIEEVTHMPAPTETQLKAELDFEKEKKSPGTIAQPQKKSATSTSLSSEPKKLIETGSPRKPEPQSEPAPDLTTSVPPSVHPKPTPGRLPERSLQAFLLKLNKDLNILKEREAKWGGNVPLELLNQIDDHEQAIVLTRQAIASQISTTELEEALKPLNLSALTFHERVKRFLFGRDDRSQRTRLLAGIGVSVLVVVIGLFIFFAGQGGAGGEEVDPTAIAATVVANITAEAAKGITEPEGEIEDTVATAVAATQQAQAEAEAATDTPTSAPGPTNTPATPVPTSTPEPPPPPVVLPTYTPPSGPLTSTITAADGAPMVLVPAGPFTMGSDSWTDIEQPVHEVILDDFYIDQYEVTNGQFRQCVEVGLCEEPTTCDFGEPMYKDETKDDHPVVCVNWEQANTYCEWRGDRLPTEAEWEKAARGTDGRTYPWGENITCQLANYSRCEGDTTPVGSYPDGVSPYGVHDMAGNVWEWVADWYDPLYYATAPSHNPQGPADGTRKVLRGSSWFYNDIIAPSANRNGSRPGYQSYNYGFRCVADALE